MGGLGRVMPLTARDLLHRRASPSPPRPSRSSRASGRRTRSCGRRSAPRTPAPIPGCSSMGWASSRRSAPRSTCGAATTSRSRGRTPAPEIETRVHESPPAITWVLAVARGPVGVRGRRRSASRATSSAATASRCSKSGSTRCSPTPEARFRDGRGLGLELGAHGPLRRSSRWCAWSSPRARYGARRAPTNGPREERKLPGFKLLQNKYYVDEIYEASVVRGVLAPRLVFAEMDRWIVDGIVNGVAVLARAACVGQRAPSIATSSTAS